MIWRLRFIISFLHPAAYSLFGFELHGRQKEVSVEAQVTIEIVEQLQLLLSIKAAVTNGAADHRIILLFHKTVIIFAVRTRASEGKFLIPAVTLQLRVNELAPIVAVEAEQGKRQVLPKLFQGCEDPDLRLVLDCHGLGPGGGDVGQVQGLTIIAHRMAAIMAHQIDLSKAGALLVPIGEGANRDLVLEQRPGPSARARSQLIFASLRAQQSINGGGANLPQLRLWSARRNSVRCVAPAPQSVPLVPAATVCRKCSPSFSRA